jgi:DNA-binding CsgD family transcriptional regulator
MPPDPAAVAPLDEVAFWRDALLSDPELGFAILDADGRLIFANNTCSEILVGSPAGVVIGLTLEELFLAPVASERMDFLERVTRSARPLLVTEVWRGVRCRSMWRVLPGVVGRGVEVLWTVRRAPLPFPDGEPVRADILEAQHVDWGALSPLSALQRRLLAMIGASFSEEQVAASLSLSRDEVRIQRMAIEDALHTTSLAILTRRALAAGLVPM